MIGLILMSCIRDDIDSSPGVKLSFSTDTVSFGTVFTDLGTPTARLIVRNPNSKGVSISSIRLSNPDSNFSFNVDGVSGTEFQDVEIRGHDSIYVFIECFIDADESLTPVCVSDRMLFTTNGNTQEVELEARGLNVRRLRGLRVESDMTLTPELPYVVFDSLIVEKGATLTILPGTDVLFHDKASLTVRGRLDAVGEPGAMINMRGDRIDNVLPDVGYDILAGQWTGIRIDRESFGNRMDYVDMRSTSEGLQIDSCGDLTRTKLTMTNSWLHNSQTNVINSQYAKVGAYGCVFSESPLAVVGLTGGEHSFVQCTIANNYLFSAVAEANLKLSHCLPEEAAGNDNPLMAAAFENCIIYGLGSPISPLKLDGSNVFLRNVLLKAEGKDDSNFIDCLWDKDPLFLTVRSDYYFNYRLQPDSPAIGAGNPLFVTEECLYDMDGLDRLSDGNPALGAYVFTEPEKPRLGRAGRRLSSSRGWN